MKRRAKGGNCSILKGHDVLDEHERCYRREICLETFENTAVRGKSDAIEGGIDQTVALTGKRCQHEECRAQRHHFFEKMLLLHYVITTYYYDIRRAGICGKTKKQFIGDKLLSSFSLFSVIRSILLKAEIFKSLLDRLIVMRSGNSDAGKRVGGVVILFDLSIFQSEAGQTIFKDVRR